MSLQSNRMMNDWLLATNQLLEYFGYDRGFYVPSLPIEDCRSCYWRLTGESPGSTVFYSLYQDRVKTGLLCRNGGRVKLINAYSDQCVYVGEALTMVRIELPNGHRSLLIFSHDKLIQD